MTEKTLVRMTCDHREHRGQTVTLDRADAEWRGCMYEKTFTVTAHTMRPECRKCGYDRFGWEYRQHVGDTSGVIWIDGQPDLPQYPHLHLVCERCSAAFDMETRDREGAK